MVAKIKIKANKNIVFITNEIKYVLLQLKI